MTDDVTRPVLRYFGGKWMLAPWIIEHFPAHRIYVEPYGGGASVLMRKPRSYAEVYNDLDGEIVNVFRTLQHPADSVKLEDLIRLTPFAREEFKWAYTLGENPVQNARRTIIRSIMGFGADGHNADKRTGFRANSNRSGTTPARDWSTYPEQIRLFLERLRGVCVENRDAKEVMAQHDEPTTLHFVDPPYVHATRKVTNAYHHDMTDKDHEDLCDFLLGLKGMVVLCGYDNGIYGRLGWETRQRAAFADGARERTEVLWLNPACSAGQAQRRLL